MESEEKGRRVARTVIVGAYAATAVAAAAPGRNLLASARRPARHPRYKCIQRRPGALSKRSAVLVVGLLYATCRPTHITAAPAAETAANTVRPLATEVSRAYMQRTDAAVSVAFIPVKLRRRRREL